jgi:hypothetical protein
MDSASDFGSGGCGFESRLALLENFVVYLVCKVTKGKGQEINKRSPAAGLEPAANRLRVSTEIIGLFDLSELHNKSKVATCTEFSTV